MGNLKENKTCPVSSTSAVFSRSHERQRTALRWQRDMFSFIYNFLMVRDSAMKRAPFIKQTVWPPNFAGKSKCSNWMTFIENV